MAAVAEVAAAAETDLEALTAADAVVPADLVVDAADLVVDAVDLVVDLADRVDRAATVDHVPMVVVVADHEGEWVASTVIVDRARPQDRLKTWQTS